MYYPGTTQTPRQTATVVIHQINATVLAFLRNIAIQIPCERRPSGYLFVHAERGIEGDIAITLSPCDKLERDNILVTTTEGKRPFIPKPYIAAFSGLGTRSLVTARSFPRKRSNMIRSLVPIDSTGEGGPLVGWVDLTAGDGLCKPGFLPGTISSSVSRSDQGSRWAR